jgi:hypothetical protein
MKFGTGFGFSDVGAACGRWVLPYSAVIGGITAKARRREDGREEEEIRSTEGNTKRQGRKGAKNAKEENS